MKEKVVSVVVNGHVVPGVHMKVRCICYRIGESVMFADAATVGVRWLQLGAAGEAFFVEDADEPVDSDYNTSPLASPMQSAVSEPPSGALQGGEKQQQQSVHFDLHSGSSQTSSPSGSSAGGDFGDSLEWHDAYRCVQSHASWLVSTLEARQAD